MGHYTKRYVDGLEKDVTRLRTDLKKLGVIHEAVALWRADPSPLNCGHLCDAYDRGPEWIGDDVRDETLKALRAEIERLRTELKESQFTIECLAGTPAHGGSKELATLRAKAALADDVAASGVESETPRYVTVQIDRETWSQLKNTALAERKETT